MRALTMTQPWASLAALAEKSIETRSWGTSYRGPLAIHAAKGMPDWAIEWFEGTDAARTMLARHGIYEIADLPRGCILGTSQLVACRATEQIMADDRSGLRKLGKERVLGDYSPGRFGLYLADQIPLSEPIPARGALSLWEWDNEAAGVEALVTGRLF